MQQWIEIVAAAIGGGAITKILDIFVFPIRWRKEKHGQSVQEHKDIREILKESLDTVRKNNEALTELSNKYADAIVKLDKLKVELARKEIEISELRKNRDDKD